MTTTRPNDLDTTMVTGRCANGQHDLCPRLATNHPSIICDCECHSPAESAKKLLEAVESIVDNLERAQGVVESEHLHLNPDFNRHFTQALLDAVKAYRLVHQ